MNHIVCWKHKGKSKAQQIQTVRTHTFVLHHRNLYLQNPTSCPSASKDASLLNTPQNLHLKRNICGRVMFNKLLSLPQAMLRLQNLSSHNNPKAQLHGNLNHPLKTQSYLFFCSQTTNLILCLHQQGKTTGQDSGSNHLYELYENTCCRNQALSSSMDSSMS